MNVSAPDVVIPELSPTTDESAFRTCASGV